MLLSFFHVSFASFHLCLFLIFLSTSLFSSCFLFVVLSVRFPFCFCFAAFLRFWFLESTARGSIPMRRETVDNYPDSVVRKEFSLPFRRDWFSWTSSKYMYFFAIGLCHNRKVFPCVTNEVRLPLRKKSASKLVRAVGTIRSSPLHSRCSGFSCDSYPQVRIRMRLCQCLWFNVYW